MKKLIVLLFLFTGSVYSQSAGSTNFNFSLGYKAGEINITHTLESEIILGGAFSLTDSKIVQDRANSANIGVCLHKANSKYTPAAFVLFGGNFDRVNIITKIGSAYVDQKICYIKDSRQTDGNFVDDTKKFYLAVGAEIMVNLSDSFGISAAYDNVSSAMIGVNFKIN